jgi:ferredoxin-NADP reductase
LPAYDPFSRDGANFNQLIDSGLRDPVSGGMPMRSTRCDVALDRRAGEDGRWTGFRAFRVAAVDAESEEVASISFEPVDGGAIPDYRAGQYLTLRVAVPRSTPLTRSYSLSDNPSAPGRKSYRVTVKRIADNAATNQKVGVVSAYLTRELRVGDVVEAQAPSGTFVLPLEPDFPVVLIAAGIGITPFMSYLEAVAATNRTAEIVLFYGNTDSRRHAFARRLAELARKIPSLKIVTYYSRPSADDVLGQHYQAAGRLTAGAIPQDLIDRRARFYMCGPSGLMEQMTDGLVSRGAFPFEIFKEIFRSPVSAQDIPDAGPFDIRFSRSDRKFTWRPSDGTLLDFADKAGYALPSGCRVGQCESCSLRLVSGTVRHLGEAYVEDGTCLTCLSVPSSDLVLDG